MVSMNFKNGLQRLTKSVAIGSTPPVRISYDWGTVVSASPNAEVILDTDPSATPLEIAASGVGPLSVGWRVLLRIEGQRLEVIASPTLGNTVAAQQQLLTQLQNNFNVIDNGEVLARNSSGQLEGVAFSTQPDNGVIVQRATSGQIAVPITPTSTMHATSKSYVDSQFQETGWVSFSSASGYNNGSGTYAPAYRIKNGVVYLKGWIAKNSGSFGTAYETVGTVPSAIIPSIDMGAFPSTTASTASASSGQPFVIINSVGNIRVAAAASPGANRVYLSSVHYLI